MEVDGKPSMGMPPPLPAVHCCVCYPGGIIPWGRFCSRTGDACVASGIGSAGATATGGGLSRIPITDNRQHDGQTYRMTDITTGLHIASFAYIGERLHKNRIKSCLILPELLNIL